MEAAMSKVKVPGFLSSRLLAVVLALGMGGGIYVADSGLLQVPASELQQAQADPYVQAVLADKSTSDAVKLAMVMGHFYESSGKHIGTAYVDTLGRGQPLTVCNGITGAGVAADRWYSPADCYQLERGRYLAAKREAARLVRGWGALGVMTQAVVLDFIHNKGAGALATSTLLRKLNVGDASGACAENPRWNKGTVKGMQKVLPGLQLRGDANGEICTWRVEPAA
jgi:lysozyme